MLQQKSPVTWCARIVFIQDFLYYVRNYRHISTALWYCCLLYLFNSLSLCLFELDSQHNHSYSTIWLHNGIMNLSTSASFVCPNHSCCRYDHIIEHSLYRLYVSIFADSIFSPLHVLISSTHTIHCPSFLPILTLILV